MTDEVTQARTMQQILDELHKIIVPGEDGNDPDSHADDDTAAWKRLGELHEELAAIVQAQDLQDFTIFGQRDQ